MGYEKDRTYFCSGWGAVLPGYQGVGIASEMIVDQHDWCRERGYRKIQVRSHNHFTAMISLNLKFGFKIKRVQLAGNLKVEDLKNSKGTSENSGSSPVLVILEKDI